MPPSIEVFPNHVNTAAPHLQSPQLLSFFIVLCTAYHNKNTAYCLFTYVLLSPVEWMYTPREQDFVSVLLTVESSGPGT